MDVVSGAERKRGGNKEVGWVQFRRASEARSGLCALLLSVVGNSLEDLGK